MKTTNKLLIATALLVSLLLSSCSYQGQQYRQLARMSKKVTKQNSKANFWTHQSEGVLHLSTKYKETNEKASIKKTKKEVEYLNTLNVTQHKKSEHLPEHNFSFYGK